MSPRELVQAFESAGGVLTVDKAEVRFFCPKAAAPFVELIRQQRKGVLEILRVRAMESVLRWMQQYCVRARGVFANPRILHREFCSWAKLASTEDAFIQQLQALGFNLDDDSGMVMGLALGDDFIAARHYQRESSTAERYIQ